MPAPVAHVVRLFGGMDAMRASLRERRRDLIKEWMGRGRIPHFREHQVRAAAKAHRVKVPAELWAELFPEREAA